MMSDRPKISIITPCLNSAAYLEQAITSVTEQGYANLEHIVMDGGSSDGSLDILKKYSHITWVSEPDNGQSDAMNKGFQLSTGEVIAYLNADDYFEPGVFELVGQIFAREQSTNFLVGDCQIEDTKRVYLPSKSPKLTLYEMLQWWRHTFPMNPLSYFYRREVQEKVGSFDETNHFAMDYDFLLRAAMFYRFQKVEKVFGTFRFLPGTKTYSSSHSKEHDARLFFTQAYWRNLDLLQQIRIRASWLALYRLSPIWNSIKYVGLAPKKFRNLMQSRAERAAHTEMSDLTNENRE